MEQTFYTPSIFTHTLNWKCPICDKFIFPFTFVNFHEATPDTVVIYHKKCVSSQEACKE